MCQAHDGVAVVHYDQLIDLKLADQAHRVESRFVGLHRLRSRIHQVASLEALQVGVVFQRPYEVTFGEDARKLAVIGHYEAAQMLFREHVEGIHRGIVQTDCR